MLHQRPEPRDHPFPVRTLAEGEVRSFLDDRMEREDDVGQLVDLMHLDLDPRLGARICPTLDRDIRARWRQRRRSEETHRDAHKH